MKLGWTAIGVGIIFAITFLPMQLLVGNYFGISFSVIVTVLLLFLGIRRVRQHRRKPNG